jgi:DNA-binding transcriptional LysR family regulator
MVLAGLGVALLPTTAVAGELRTGTLRRIELIGTPRIERRIAALRRLDNDGRSPAATSFWTLLQRFDTAASDAGESDEVTTPPARTQDIRGHTE